MGLLEHPEDGRRIALGPRCLFGRHAACDVCIDDLRVSGEHASLHWTGVAWELRDLGSRNGTFLEEKRLGPGERVALAEGATFAIGWTSNRFVLADASTPTARARHLVSSAVRVASDGLLVLPDDDTPIAALVLLASGRWALEMNDDLQPVADQQVLLIGGDPWQFDVPKALATTRRASGADPSLDAIALRFGVSRDEEYVEIDVLDGDRALPLPPRAHHYVLLTLARAFLGDAAAPPAERGWLDRDALCRMLATDLNKLNVEIHRIRKQFEALGVAGAAGIVVRRPTTGQIRIGVPRVEVRTL
jgi:hypothetical protein